MINNGANSRRTPVELAILKWKNSSLSLEMKKKMGDGYK